MGFLQKTRTLILGHLNELVDRTVDLDSIPVLKQYVRDLEDAIDSSQHQLAMSRSQITTLTRELENAKSSVSLDTQRAQAFLKQSNESAARAVATRIADEQAMIPTLQSQIQSATEQSHVLYTAVEKMRTKHNSILSRIRELESKDRASKSLEQATASIKSAGAALNQGVDSSVDDVARRIEARNDQAQEEFQEVSGSLDSPEDPLKTQAVDDILNQLRPGGNPSGAPSPSPSAPPEKVA